VGGGSVEVAFDVRPVYDFMISLSDDAGSTDDLPEPDRTWLSNARAAGDRAFVPVLRAISNS
jgi:hypothetical protein